MASRSRKSVPGTVILGTAIMGEAMCQTKSANNLYCIKDFGPIETQDAGRFDPNQIDVDWIRFRDDLCVRHPNSRVSHTSGVEATILPAVLIEKRIAVSVAN